MYIAKSDSNRNNCMANGFLIHYISWNIVITPNRQQTEAKLTWVMSCLCHKTTESVSQQELKEWKDMYEQSKEKAKEYSELVSQVPSTYVRILTNYIANVYCNCVY